MKESQKRLTRLVWIKWVDSTITPFWRDLDELEVKAQGMNMSCESVGWVVHEDRTRIMVSQSKTMDFDSAGNMITIPKAAVVEIQDILG